MRRVNLTFLGVGPADLDAVVLTHAHFDHSGYLPVLAKQGFTAKIMCSPATRELCSILLPDAGHLQEEGARYASKRGFSKHKPVVPLFTAEDAKRVLKQLVAVDLGQDHSPGEGMRFRVHPAAHFLGAAIVEIDVHGRRSRRMPMPTRLSSGSRRSAGRRGRPMSPTVSRPPRRRCVIALQGSCSGQPRSLR